MPIDYKIVLRVENAFTGSQLIEKEVSSFEEAKTELEKAQDAIEKMEDLADEEMPPEEKSDEEY